MPRAKKRRCPMENNSALHIKTVITGVIATLTALWGWFGWLVIVWL